MRVGDRIGMSVTLGGVDVTGAVESFRARFGFDQRVAEADVTFALTPPFKDWGELVIQAGLTSINGDTAGPLTARFNGLAVNNGVQFWPYTPKLAGRGWLVLADKTLVTDDLWAKHLNPTETPDPLALPAAWDPPGIDMTIDGEGQKDSDQVMTILDACGLGAHYIPAFIGGLKYLLGTQIARAFEQFVWRRGQSGLAYIESLDAMYGFRTFETPDGFIRRKLTSNVVPPFYTVAATLNENQDVLEGASIQRDIDNIFNRVVVTGYDNGGGGNVWVEHGAVDILPPGVVLQTENFQNPYIEHLLLDEKYHSPPDPPELDGMLIPGLSCEEVAKYWLSEFQYPMLEAVVPTWRDDAFEVGSTIYLNCPHLLGVNQAMTLKHLEVEVTPTTFTQILTLRAQDYGVFRAPPTLPLSLGTRL